MSGTFKGLTQAQIDRRLKDGRGQGQGSDYKPFIYTRDVSSLGRSHRLPGSKTRRLHHLLSDLELAIFLTLDRSPHVTDIREQFPMRVEDTVRIAEELGLPHGRYKGTPQVLTSDFLVDFEGHCCKVSDEAAFCLIQRPYISKTLLTRRISPRGSP